jgi:membrane-associated phospholipid phosphatase
MMDFLLSWDFELFRLLNGTWHTSWLDWVMPWWREKTTWIPLYLVLAAWAVLRFRWKGVAWIVALVAVVAVGDIMSHRVIKKSVQRERPCRTAELEADLRLLVRCGGGYSFTSNHATNHFAVAVFILGTLGRFLGRWRFLFLLWAATIAYGQVYVGVHFPLDVFAGALLGSLIGWVGTLLFNRFATIPYPGTQVQKV